MNKNPNQLKSKINKLITANYAVCDNTKLPKIIDNYKPGYLYDLSKYINLITLCTQLYHKYLHWFRNSQK